MIPLNYRNLQKPEKFVNNPDLLEVHSIFPTIQGEGPFSGRRSIFIRIAGCNLQCPLCDTEYTRQRLGLTPNQIMEEVCLMADKKGWHEIGLLIVITGGEPFRQNLDELLKRLIRQKFHVQIETNGAAPICDILSKSYHVVCSPKVSFVSENNATLIQYWKYVVEHDGIDERDGLPTSVLGNNVRPFRPHNIHSRKVYVSPCDSFDSEINKKNIDAAVKSCMTHGYTLSLQTHKLLGLP